METPSVTAAVMAFFVGRGPVGVLDGQRVGHVGRAFHDVHDDAADRDREHGREQSDLGGNREDVDGLDVLGLVDTGALGRMRTSTGMAPIASVPTIVISGSFLQIRISNPGGVLRPWRLVNQFMNSILPAARDRSKYLSACRAAVSGRINK